VDVVVLPIFKAVLRVIDFGGGFNPIDSLGTGRSVSWATLGLAFVRVVVVLGGACAAAGIWAFTRREIARVRLTS
jgi:hypothetical protein